MVVGEGMGTGGWVDAREVWASRSGGRVEYGGGDLGSGKEGRCLEGLIINQ